MSQLQITRPKLLSSIQEVDSTYLSHVLLDEDNTGSSSVTEYYLLFEGMSLNFSQSVIDLRDMLMTSTIKSAQNTRDIFLELSESWQNAVLCESSMLAITTHPDYQKIIGLGESVVSFILEEMSCKPNHWFVALQAITRQDPAVLEEAGDIRAMTRAWLRWGRLNGYIT